MLLNDGNLPTDLGWYEGVVTKVYNEHTIQWQCDDGETLDQINLAETQWTVLPMNEAQKFLMRNRIRVMKRKRKVNISPRPSRKHWKQQLQDPSLQNIKRKYQQAVRRSKREDQPSRETKDTKKIKRGHDRLKQCRKRELDDGDGNTSEEDL
jgi:hypothetical protein